MQLNFLETKRRMLAHFKMLKSAWAHTEARLLLDMTTFVVYIEYHGKLLAWCPQFQVYHEENTSYTMEFSDDAALFLGWRPYLVNRIAWMSDKWEFKQWLVTQSLNTPAFCDDPANKLNNVIIKNKFSSFALGIQGPYASNQEQPINPNEAYYEQLIQGEILKIWYWNDVPIVFEQQAMPTVVGNGRDSLKNLLEARMQENLCKPSWENILAFLKFRGIDYNVTVDLGETIWVDFRYGSLVRKINSITEKSVLTLEDNALKSTLQIIGKCIYERLESENCQELLYTVDAILDIHGQLWILECNANPSVHPGAYGPMAKHALSEFDINDGDLSFQKN